MVESEETQDDREAEPKGNLVALAYGLAALALACLPPALFATAADAGQAVPAMFADAKNWVGLSRFCLASLILVAPVFWLVRLSDREARHWAATLPTIPALILAVPMVPGAVIQLAWWIAG